MRQSAMNTANIMQSNSVWHLNLPRSPNAYQAETAEACAAHAFRVRGVDAVRVLDCEGEVIEVINRTPHPTLT